MTDSINKKEIENLLPHRDPMLLIDKLINIVDLKSATAIVNVKKTSFFVQGHFPDQPVMPGVLIIESMAQTSALLVVHNLGGDANGKLVYFMSIDGARFRKPVVPGDQLWIHAVKLRNRGNVWKFSCEAKVDETLVAEAIITAMISDDEVKR